MLTIAPQKAFLVDIKLNNPSDTDTHYVRAVIKESISGTILATLNLEDQGNRYFSKEWITPADITGTGLQISIDITVYDDSGYTNESLVYGTLHETYIVREMPSPRMGFAAGSVGSSTGIKAEKIDYEKIKELIREVLAEKEIPEKKEVDLMPILEGIKRLEGDDTLLKVISDLYEYLKTLEAKISQISLSLPEDMLDMPRKIQDLQDYRDDLHKFLEKLAINSRTDIGEIKRMIHKSRLESMPVKESEKTVDKVEKPKENIRPAILKLLSI